MPPSVPSEALPYMFNRYKAVRDKIRIYKTRIYINMINKKMETKRKLDITNSYLNVLNNLIPEDLLLELLDKINSAVGSQRT